MKEADKQPPQTSKTIAAIIVAAIFIVPIIYILSDEESSEESSQQIQQAKGAHPSRVNHASNMLAYNLSAEYVTKHLKLPNTAEFPSLFEKKDHVYPTGDTLFVVTSWVDSQNDLGAVVRNRWRCVVKIKNDNAEFLGLDIDGVRIL
ncbi:MAG: hypothetical protein Salg2KO_14830 [Salibacteraceae bacterium]